MLIRNGLCQEYQNDFLEADKNDKKVYRYIASKRSITPANFLPKIAYKIINTSKSVFGKSDYQCSVQHLGKYEQVDLSKKQVKIFGKTQLKLMILRNTSKLSHEKRINESTKAIEKAQKRLPFNVIGFFNGDDEGLAG